MQDLDSRIPVGKRLAARTLAWLALAVLAGGAPSVKGQWITQTNALKPGWNAVFLHVDASHDTLDNLVGADLNIPIEEIWYWQPALPTGQFVESPQLPTGAGSQWYAWTRASGAGSALQRLTGNGAYLVKVANTVASYNWRVKGTPVTPTFRWTLTGLNFIGFPTPTTPAPSFESLLAPAPQLQQNGEVYRYQGGELGPTNPVRLLAFRTTPVRRDQAYWVRAGESYNQYFGPIQIVRSGSGGIQFGTTLGQSQLRLRNLANVPVTITLRQIASEAAPSGQSNIVGTVPLLLRGPINTTNLTFGYTDLSAGPRTWNLAAAGQTGSEIEVVIGLNRSQLSGVPGDLSASVLRFTDSLGLSQIDLAVSAEKESAAGLWVGGAVVDSVHHYLKPYARATNSADFAALIARLGTSGHRYEHDTNTGRVLVFGGPEQKSGSYLLDGAIKIDSGKVARPFPLRLILHNDGSAARLLQKVFHGIGPGSNAVLTTRENLLHPARLGEARRISSIHFPTSSGNISWALTGTMQPGGSLVGNVPLAYDDHSSNPFLHTYHPDHDNLDAQFKTTLARGNESYDVSRAITLSFTTPDDDFNSLTRGAQDLTGIYREDITFRGRGSQTREYNVLGIFTLKRLSDIATLISN